MPFSMTITSKRKEYTPFIFTVSDLLSPAECADFITQSEVIGYDLATINSLGGQVVNTKVRNNDRVILDDESLAESLWQKVQPHAPSDIFGRCVLGLNERFRFYRYQPGQKFSWHMDGAYERPNGERSEVTLLFYLNDEFEGGETQFIVQGLGKDGIIKIQPAVGLALFFHHPIVHQGAEVTQGTKYILRTDVMYAP